MERQHNVAGVTARDPRSQRSVSETSSNPATGGSMGPSMGQPQAVTAQAMSHGSGAMSITSIIEHPMRHDLSLSGQSMGDLAHAGIGPAPLGYRHEWNYGPMGSADSPIYSSDSCSSPMSDYPNAQMPYFQRPGSTFSDSSFHQQTSTSPLSAGPSYQPAWSTFDPSPAYDGTYVSSVGIRSLGHPM
ncbi:MAG: hypothetical protein Q9222_006986 [Ikaeria aurantiellina]